jgi:hypothetical protein
MQESEKSNESLKLAGDKVKMWVRLAEQPQLLGDSLRLIFEKASCGHSGAIFPVLELCRALSCTGVHS